MHSEVHLTWLSKKVENYFIEYCFIEKYRYICWPIDSLKMEREMGLEPTTSSLEG